MGVLDGYPHYHRGGSSVRNRHYGQRIPAVNVSIKMHRPPTPGSKAVRTRGKASRWTKIGIWCWVCGFLPAPETTEARLQAINHILRS